MARFSSQLIFCSPNEILRRSVVEINEQNIIKSIFSLDNTNVESSNTLFFDGIISASGVQLRREILSEKLESIKMDYQYFNLEYLENSNKITPNNKPLLLDFSSNSADIIYTLICKYADILEDFSTFDIISGLVYHPAIVNGQDVSLKPQHESQLWLWQNTNLVSKKMTRNTHIQKLR